MRMSEPNWDHVDAGLRTGPFRTRRFTPEHAAGVRRRMAAEIEGERRPSRRPAWRRMALAAGAVCAAGMAIVVATVGWGEQESRVPSGHSGAAYTAGDARQAVAGVVPPVTAGDRPTLPVRMPDDGQWQALIGQSFPDVQTSILHKTAIRDDVMLVLSRKLLEAEDYLSFSLVVDEFVWTKAGWKSQARVGYHPGDNVLESAERGLLTGWSGISLDSADSGQFVTLFYGAVANPAIVAIRVTDDDGRVHEASLHDAGDGFAYWFAALPPGERGSYVVEGAAADDTLLYEQSFHER